MIYEYIIPLIPSEPQLLNTTLPLGNENKRIELCFRYNDMAEYWWLDIRDPIKGLDLICGIPILTGCIPAENLLEQFEYLQIGSCAIIPETNRLLDSIPTFDTLGIEWQLIWGENSETVS